MKKFYLFLGLHIYHLLELSLMLLF